MIEVEDEEGSNNMPRENLKGADSSYHKIYESLAMTV